MRRRIGSTLRPAALSLLAAVLLSRSAALRAGEPVPLLVTPDQVPCVVYVDGRGKRAADTNPGTQAAPLKTIGRAVSLALANKAQGTGTRIVIRPGVYRESVILKVGDYQQDTPPGSLDTSAALVLEAEKPGTVILEGADVWDGWQAGGSAGVYTHSWPHAWGTLPNPWADSGVVFPPVLGRREMILVDGEPLRQVLDRQDLAPGRFQVSEEEHTVVVQLPAGVRLGRARIEVAVRGDLLGVQGLRNVVVRGLVAQHSANRKYITPFYVAKVRNALVEDCVSRWHNWDGFGVYSSDDTVVRRLTVEHCGAGNTVLFSRNVLLEDIEITACNWRGAWNHFYGWDIGAIKAMYNHGLTCRGYRARDNQCGALWLDTDNEHVVCERCTWIDNLGGLVFENNRGPSLITDCIIARNSIGVVIDKTENGVLEGNTIYGNTYAQIALQGPPATSFKNWETGETVNARCQNWTWRRNVVVSSTAETSCARGAMNYLLMGVKAPLLTMPQWDYFLKTLTSSGNLWYHPLPEAAFQVGTLAYSKEPLGGLSFDEWRAVAGQDLDSVFAPPAFVDGEHQDFAPTPESPLRRRDAWPRLTRAEVEGKVPGMHPEVGRYLEAQRAIAAPPQPAAAEEPFPLAAQASASAWHPLDLAAVANRALTGDEAWINIPLTQLAPGRAVLRGVPFQVLDQERNHGAAALALRSATLGSSRGRELPAQVELPVGRPARAVYILHGGGWMTAHEKVAEYEVLFADGSSARLPVIVYGKDAGVGAAPESLRQESVIQDWWYAFPQFASDQARSVRLAGDSSPNAERYLYVLQWLNPSPEKVIKTLRLTSDPQRSATVIVLGITLLD